MAKLFTLGGTPFSRPDSLARNVKSILHRYTPPPSPNQSQHLRCRGDDGAENRHALESKLNKEEQALVQDLLQQGHHRAEEKIGCGVKHIKVGAHPDHPESRCFHLVRTDGTTTDFSYRKVPPPHTHTTSARTGELCISISCWRSFLSRWRWRWCVYAVH